jgi:mono/diheme cytochrome c family protein
MPAGSYEVFADGFAGKATLMSPRDARFRACGLAVGPDGSLYISDSEKGRIWRVFYSGEKVSPDKPTTPAKPQEGVSSRSPDGAAVYAQNCAVCHMADGGGVPSMQPSLVDSAVVAGDAGRVIDVVLRGPAAVLPADREPYSNTMPAFGRLSDSEVASVVSYVRKQFAAGASAVTPSMVAAQRKS